MEILDLYDSKKRKLNKTIIRQEGEPELGEYKLSVHIWIMNSKGEFLIQKRSERLIKNPGKWACTAGAVDAGETSLDGAMRETKEELGIDVDIDKIEFLLSFKREYTFVDVWLVKDDIDIQNVKLQEEEVSEAKWVSVEELNDLIRSDKFVQSINLYYDLFIKTAK